MKKATIASPADLRRASNVSVAKSLPYGRLVRLLSESYGEALPSGLLTKDELVEAASGLGVDLATLLREDEEKHPWKASEDLGATNGESNGQSNRNRVCYDQEGILDNFSSPAAAGLLVRRAPRSATPQNPRANRRMSSPDILQGRGLTNEEVQHSFHWETVSSSFPPHQPSMTRPPGPGTGKKHKKKGLARKRTFSKKFLTLGRESRSEDRPAAIMAQIRKGSAADTNGSPPKAQPKEGRRKTANPVYSGTTAFLAPIHDMTIRPPRRSAAASRKGAANAAPLHDITVRPPKRS